MSGLGDTDRARSRLAYHPRQLWALAALLLLAYAAISLHWNERFYFNLIDHLHAGAWAGKSIWLPDYRMDIEAKPLAQVHSDLSGITYDYDHDQLLAVTNAGPAQVLSLTKAGEVTGSYPLVGFSDTEDITYMGDGLLAVVEERLQQVDFFRLPGRPGPIDKRSARSIALGIKLSTHNKGFEGIDYDARHDRLYLVKERDPRQLYVIDGVRASLNGNLQLNIEDRTDWVDESVFSTDLSAVHVDSETGHLLLLSQESNALFELSDQGEMVSARTFLSGLSDVHSTIPQPEGVTMDDAGNLYVVSEPNLFYVLRNGRQQAAAH